MSADLGFPTGARVVFQGDSITHGGRGPTEDPNHILGHSYPFLIASAAAAALPERDWRFVNRGVSGDTVADLAARWHADAIDLRPDVLSILVGVNDVDAVLSGESGDADGSAFAAEYRLLLDRTRTALPNVLLVLGEPFYLPTSPAPELRADWAAAVALRATIVRDLANTFDATFVPNQAAFDAAVLRAPAEHWIWDGIHPTYAGQRVLADAWITAVTSPRA
ncbi:SGNH/GDSL hydrolase family protein [Kribbella sp. NPDC051620]|uniref:SGNH/GDSL hydrolase family protein n=1 Tax=Kribbella sp. NPDC051620 TaxID=3364120 RepID=UPI003794F4AA